MDEVYSIGDCTFVSDGPLPATAQVASQQGSYLGRLFSKGFATVGSEGSGMASPEESDDSPTGPTPPLRVLAVDESEADKFASETLPFGKLGVAKALEEAKDDSRKVVEYAKPFQFLNLGVLAYVGAAEAVAQISVDDKTGTESCV
jgi:NADH dehydrogenase FAD-containing subunit